MYNVKRLKERRLRLGMSAEEAANRLGVCADTLRKWEQERRRPHEGMLKLYSSMLKQQERLGPLGNPKYDNGVSLGETSYAEFGRSDVVLRDISRYGMTSRECAGMMGMPQQTWFNKSRRQRSVTERECMAMENLLYELRRRGCLVLKGERVRLARSMLRYYFQRQARWHGLIYRTMAAMKDGDYSSQKFSSVCGGSGHSDPVSRHYLRVERLQKAQEFALKDIYPAMQVILAIQNSDVEEDREMFLIFERNFREEESIEDIAASLGKSPRTLYRRRYELVNRVAQNIGERIAEC